MKALQICLVVFLAIVLLAVSAVAVFLTIQFRFPEGTVICKTDVSNMFTWLAAPQIQETVNAYTLNVTLEGKQVTLTAEELGLTFDEEKLNQLVEEYEVGTPVIKDQDFLSMNPAAVEAMLEQHLPENQVEPGAVQLLWNQETGSFDLELGADGEINDRSLALEKIVKSVYRMDSAVILTQADYRTSFTDDEKVAAAMEAMQVANAYVANELTYTFYLRGGQAVPVVIDSNLIGSWLELDESGLAVTVNEAEVREYADAMAKTYSSQGGDGYFLTSNGVEINLPATSPANLVDADALYQDILASLGAETVGPRDVPYTAKAEYGNFDGTYIEVSIIDQKMWAYLDGELFAETSVITGCAHCDHDTLTGVFKVQNHVRDIWLQDAYFVNYWMGFSIPKYGLHDADRWRTEAEYGGETYKTNGSGGCINVPGKIISEMFTAFENGVPVIIYDDSYALNASDAE